MRTRTNNNTTRTTPTIRIHPPRSSGHVAASNDGVARKLPSPDLTIHSRPKTLAEIKSKRRLSLSVLPSFTRASSPVLPVNVGHRARPASALAFYPRPPPLSSFRAGSETTTSQHLEVPRLSSSRSLTPTAVSGTVRSESIPTSASMALHRDSLLTADAIKKKNRRFSLSALSNFAGHRDESSWGGTHRS